MDGRKIPTHILVKGKKVSLRPKTQLKNQLGNGYKTETYLKLTELVEGSQVLFKAKTVFPFVLFPDEIIIDRDKVSIITSYFILSSRQQSILIKNISDVYTDTSVFFASIKIIDKYFAENNLEINYLRKKDAIFARNIIQGLIACHEKEIDLAGLKNEELLLYLEEIGKATAQ